VPIHDAGSASDGLTVGLVVHPHKAVHNSVQLIAEQARQHGFAVVGLEADAERLGPQVAALSRADFLDRVNALVSLGGDGTMLGAMRLVAGRGVPVLGVNHGNLGFLVEVEPADLGPALDRIRGGDFTLEPHSCLDVETDGETEEADLAKPLTAFNDLVVTSAQPWSALTVDLLVSGSRHGYYRCDALVACTPTGSTAYNYAAGGPVVSPSTPSITLTPVAPMSGVSRSVVLGADDVVTLQATDGEALRICADGVRDANPDDRPSVTLRLRPDAVDVIRLDAGTHAQRSRVKLSLLDLPLRPDQLLELVPAPLREQAGRLRRPQD
jgi:NAD+ kinase